MTAPTLELQLAEGLAARPLLELVPRLESRVAFEPLGVLPTPVEPLETLCGEQGLPGCEAWVKRDDVTSPVYGGNKVRTLEVLFGLAKSRGTTHIYSTGAFGSNHAVATVLHAPRAGLVPGVVLFPQPRSWAALENLRVVLARHAVTRALPHWSALPLGMLLSARLGRRRGERLFIMVPGGATPEGALGYVSAGLELALQVARHELPAPQTVVVGVGSTCTSAGLLVGFELAARRGIGFLDRAGQPNPPHLLSVRVTPWPVTSRWRILTLAARTARLLAELAGDPTLAFDARTLAARFRVDGGYIGKGYGHATPEGRAAMALWHEHGRHELDTTYSAKAAAAVLDLVKREPPAAPLVFWSTKSSVPLPVVRADDLRWAPPLMQRWIRRAERELAKTGELPDGYDALG